MVLTSLPRTHSSTIWQAKLAKQTNILPLVAIAGAYLLYRKFANDAADRRLLTSVRVQLKDISIKGGRIVIQVNVQNPTSSPVVVRSIVGDLYFNDIRVGNVQSFQVMNLHPNSEGSLVADIALKIPDVMTTVANAISQRSGVVFTFNGHINVNNDTIPLTINYRSI